MRVPQRSLELTQVTEWHEGCIRPLQDPLAAEEPLEIRIDDKPIAVTMRTPGHDLELAAGFLLTEGIIDSSEQIVELRALEPNNGTSSNGVRVHLNDVPIGSISLERNFFAASSCGICGKASINAIRVRGLRRPNPNFRVDPEVLCGLPDILHSGQAVFSRTGGLHAAALFDASGTMVVLREDIGRAQRSRQDRGLGSS